MIFVLLTVIQNIHLGLKMELNHEHFPTTIFYNFGNSAWMNLIQKLHQGPMFIDRMVNSIMVLVHYKTNCVQVVVVVSKTIDDVYELIFRDLHVTHCKIERT